MVYRRSNKQCQCLVYIPYLGVMYSGENNAGGVYSESIFTPHKLKNIPGHGIYTINLFLHCL